jgi:CRP-like cAMP-binding protein
MMTRDELLRALGEHPILRDADGSVLNQLADVGELSSLGKGERLYSRGDPADRVLLLLEGTVRSFHVLEDTEMTTTLLHAPSTLGELEVMSERSGGEKLGFFANVEASRPCTLLHVSGETFYDFLTENPRCGLELLKDLSRRASNAATRELSMFADVPARLASFLLEYLQAGDAHHENRVDLTREDLAHHLGVTVRSVGRAFSDWKQRGWISHSKGWLIIEDEKALEKVCGGHRFRLSYQPPRS